MMPCLVSKSEPCLRHRIHHLKVRQNQLKKTKTKPTNGTTNATVVILPKRDFPGIIQLSVHKRKQDVQIFQELLAIRGGLTDIGGNKVP